MTRSPVHYHDYLELDKVLEAQTPKSGTQGRKPSSDEMLFIITHQSFELWFKQIHHELDFIQEAFAKPTLADEALSLAHLRLERICSIYELMIAQFDVLMTMTPLDFLDFRDELVPASGFQSVQFRHLDARLGVKDVREEIASGLPALAATKARHMKRLSEEVEKPSLAEQMNAWLERFKFINVDQFDFETQYRVAVEDHFAKERAILLKTHADHSEALKAQLASLDRSLAAFHTIFSDESYRELAEKHGFNLSRRGLVAAIFITLYSEQPLLQLPWRFLKTSQKLNTLMSAWKSKHLAMVRMMIGTRMGTGGSTGEIFLKQSLYQKQVFQEMAFLASFLLPRSCIPKLPKPVCEQLRFAG